MKIVYITIAWLCSTSTALAQNVGDVVFVKSNKQVELKSGDKTTGNATPGGRYRVVKVNKNSVWLSDSGLQDLDGWIDRSDVVAIDEAITLYATYLQNTPDKAVWYHRLGILWVEKRDYDKAISSFTEAIRLEPGYAASYVGRGVSWRGKRNLEKALNDYREAIRLEPSDEVVYYNRGRLWAQRGYHDEAVKDYNKSIQLNPKYAGAYSYRGNAWHKKREYGKAFVDYTKAIELNPTYVNAYNARAWLQATCPDAKYRNGKRAVKDATTSCELSGWNNIDYLDTLAAAYAEIGDFEQAVTWQQKAMDLAPETEKADLDTRLRLYKSGKPFRTKPRE